MQSKMMLTATGKTRGLADAKKGNHGPRRMGCDGSIGNGAGGAGAASGETPTAHSHGRYQEAAGRRLPARNRYPASGPGKVQVVSRPGPADHLSRIRPWGRTRLKRFSSVCGACVRVSAAAIFLNYQTRDRRD